MRAENFMSTLPSVLAEDENLAALAASVSEALGKRAEEITLAGIYTRISELPEPLLDILAHDFKVDWWDWSLTTEEKRKTLARAWYVYRHMATPAAIAAALTAVYADTVCEEWFEYGGERYHFRLSMTIPEEDIKSTKHDRVLALMRFYKNLRSVLDNILYTVETPMDTVLWADSHVGRGFMSTVLPEIGVKNTGAGTARILVESLETDENTAKVEVLNLQLEGDAVKVQVREIGSTPRNL